MFIEGLVSPMNRSQGGKLTRKPAAPPLGRCGGPWEDVWSPVKFSSVWLIVSCPVLMWCERLHIHRTHDVGTSVLWGDGLWESGESAWGMRSSVWAWGQGASDTGMATPLPSFRGGPRNLLLTLAQAKVNLPFGPVSDTHQGPASPLLDGTWNLIYLFRSVSMCEKQTCGPVSWIRL